MAMAGGMFRETPSGADDNDDDDDGDAGKASSSSGFGLARRSSGGGRRGRRLHRRRGSSGRGRGDRHSSDPSAAGGRRPGFPYRHPAASRRGRPKHAGLCTAIAAVALVMLATATIVHVASGDGSPRFEAWMSLVPNAFQSDRYGAAPISPAEAAAGTSALDAAGSAAGGRGGFGGGAGGTGSGLYGSGHAHAAAAGRGTWGSSLHDGSYVHGLDRGAGGGGDGFRGLGIIPKANAETAGRTGGPPPPPPPPMPYHDRWSMGEGIAVGDAYAYLICGVPADPPACFEATLHVVARQDASDAAAAADHAASANGDGDGTRSPATSPMPWHLHVTIRDLIGFYSRDGSAFRMSDYRAVGLYDEDMRSLRSAAMFDAPPPGTVVVRPAVFRGRDTTCAPCRPI